MRFVGELFENEPKQWGLRGDQYLWRELRIKLATVELPLPAQSFTDCSNKRFTKQQEKACHSVTRFGSSDLHMAGCPAESSVVSFGGHEDFH